MKGTGIQQTRRTVCGGNRIHVCPCVCVRVRAFPSRFLIKATLKSLGASAEQPLRLFFVHPMSWGNLNCTLEISSEAFYYVTRGNSWQRKRSSDTRRSGTARRTNSREIFSVLNPSPSLKCILIIIFAYAMTSIFGCSWFKKDRPFPSKKYAGCAHGK